jgi:hypothetical protein
MRTSVSTNPIYPSGSPEEDRAAVLARLARYHPNSLVSADGLQALGYILKPSEPSSEAGSLQGYVRFIDPDAPENAGLDLAHCKGTCTGYIAPFNTAFARCKHQALLADEAGAQPRSRETAFSHDSPANALRVAARLKCPRLEQIDK